MNHSRLLTFKRPLLAAFVGASTTLAFAPFNFWPLAIISPLLLFLLLDKQNSKKAAYTGFAWGLGLFGSGVSWVHVSIDNFGGMPRVAGLFLMLALISYLSLFPALFAGLLNRFFPTASYSRLVLAAPVLWLVIDWLRGWLFTGFPWLWLGYSQIDSPLAAFGPVLGVEGITLMMVLTAGSLALTLLTKQYLPLILPAVVALATWGLMSQTWVTPIEERATEVALIQGNIPQELKWLPSQRWPTIMKYTDLSRENWDADLIIWPEAAIPALEDEIPSFLNNLDNAARMNNSAIITGVIDQKDNGEYFNNIIALGINQDGEYLYQNKSRYSKHHLLPFGEFVPFESLLRPLAPLFNLPMSSFSRGDFVQPNLNANNTQLAPALCYEVAFSEQVRQSVNEQTDFILTLSNDAWFGDSIGPLQHMEIAQMRALELGKPLIRSTNNGVTAITDHLGKITAQIPQFETAVLRGSVIPTDGMTPYRQYGSWPLYIFAVLALILALIRQRTKQ